MPPPMSPTPPRPRQHRVCFPKTKVFYSKKWARTVLTHKQPVPRDARCLGSQRKNANGSLAPGAGNGDVSGHTNNLDRLLHLPATQKTCGCTLNPLAHLGSLCLAFLYALGGGARSLPHRHTRGLPELSTPAAALFSLFVVLNYVLSHNSSMRVTS